MSHPRRVPNPVWPDRTELERRLRGNTHHHNVWCSADRKNPIGTPGSGCSCKYQERNRERNAEDPNGL